MNALFESNYFRFEKMQKWMITDLSNATIKAQANFLVAMGIFNYIEILGSFYYPKVKDKTKKRFNYVIKHLMPSKEYKVIETKTKAFWKKGLYDLLRCGLSHEYLIKTTSSNTEINFTIFGVNDVIGFNKVISSKTCGIELLEIVKNRYYFRIYNPKLIYDLDIAFENYKRELLEEENKELRSKFMSRCNDINLQNFK